MREDSLDVSNSEPGTSGVKRPRKYNSKVSNAELSCSSDYEDEYEMELMAKRQKTQKSEYCFIGTCMI